MKLIRLPIFILSVTISACTAGAGETTNATPAHSLYTDEQAQQFIRNLSNIVFPTSISSACELLGIDLSRLGIKEAYPPENQMSGLGTGSTEIHTIQLGDSYSIAFSHNINDTNQSRYMIFKVDIRNFRSREK